MVLSPIQQKLIIWARDCSHAIGDHFDATIATLNENGSPVHEYELLLRQLIISCHLSSESVFLLVSNCKLWDAEAVLRAVVEGTFKPYISVSVVRNPKAKRRDMEQRWSFHSIINSLSQSEPEVKWLGVFKHLFFQYGMGSHILHQDADGVAVVLERNNRRRTKKRS